MNFLNFENEENNCWLDACIVLIVHSKGFKDVTKNSSSSQIKKMIETYSEALVILNDNNVDLIDRYEKTRDILREIQLDTLTHLKEFLKFKAGEPESAFFALLNLIYHDKSNIKESLSTSWIWDKQCDNCGIKTKSGFVTKPIVTLPKVKSFNPSSPSTIYTCSCKKEQEMKLIFKDVPKCLIFHLENGIQKGKTIPLVFDIENHKFHLTGIIILEKSTESNINHFVTWIKKPFSDLWLDCNDLNTSLVKYSEVKPELSLKDLYVCMYESFDDFKKISLEVPAVEEIKNANADAELINLSDDESKSTTSGAIKIASVEKESSSLRKENAEIKGQEKEAKGHKNENVEGDLHEVVADTENPNFDEENHSQQEQEMNRDKIGEIVEQVFGNFFKHICDIHERINDQNH